MKLEKADGASLRNPDGLQIEEALRAMENQPDGFAILSQDEQTYLQAARREGGYIVEYQEGDTDRHFQSVREDVTFTELVELFRSYARGDTGWRTALEWRPLEI